MFSILRELVFNHQDLCLFEAHLQDRLKEIFPFSSLKLLYLETQDELEKILAHIPFSDRQRERARTHLLDGKPFWDRVLNQALVPICQNGKDPIIIGRLIGMPKSIGPEEGRWFLALARQALKRGLETAKKDTLLQKKDDIPLYIHRLLNTEADPSHILEISFYKWPEFASGYLERSLSSIFASKYVIFAGYACETIWFLLKPTTRDVGIGLKRCVHFFKKAGCTPKLIRLYDHVKALPELVDYRTLADGIGAKIYAKSLAERFLHETGIEPAAFNPSSFALKLTPKSLGCIFVFSSKKNAEMGLSLLKDKGQVIPLGERAFFTVLPFSSADKSQDLTTVCNGLFQQIKGEIDQAIFAGFASPVQPFVSKEKVFFASLLASHHAKLLGPGNMALFDNVTCNVHGDILFAWGDRSGAICSYRKGLSLKEDDVNLLNSLGACLADARRLKDAERLFKKALTIDPQNEMALYNLSGILLRQARLTEALNAILKAVNQDPYNLLYLVRLLEIYTANRSWKKAYEICRRISKSGGMRGSKVTRLCAKVAIENKKWDEAKELLKKCLQKGTEDPEAMLLLAKGFLMFEKDAETASMMLNRFWKIDPVPRGLHAEAKKLMKNMEN